jgi:myosin-1
MVSVLERIKTRANEYILGWWLAKTSAGQGWAPSAYLKEEVPPPAPVIRPTPPPPPPAAPKANGSAARSKPIPPAPPAKRPAAGRKPAPPPAPRDSGMSMNGGSSSDSGRNTPTASLAGGLAEALRARQSAMQRGRDDEDDW